MINLIFYFCLAVCVSFLCSILESVILSVSHAYVEQLLGRGKRSGRMLKALKDQIDRPLSAILTVNTIANTLGAAGVGAQALQVFGSRWVALTSALLTFSILVFSEVIPKTLGVVYWKRLAPAAAYLINGLIILVFPFVVFLRYLSGFISRRGRGERRVTREEMITLAGIGEDDGILLRKEKRIIQNLLRLKQIRVEDVMTPRSVIFALKEEDTVENVVEHHTPLRFSRIPVYRDDLDHVTGVILRVKILEAFRTKERNRSIAELASPVHAVPESKTIASTLDEFIKRKEHLFLVVDEYGGTEGIITLEDAIETLLGVEIVDEFDSVEDMRKFARDIWEKKKKRLHL